MAQDYFTPPVKARDGDTAFAEDVNSVNDATNEAFGKVKEDVELIELALDQSVADAKKWAVGPGEPPDENIEVEPGLFAAKKYANDSDASAQAASTSETNAAQSESNAASSASNAAASASNAAASESAAAISETNAGVSETNAATSEANAATSESNALVSETNAAASAASAGTSEGNAAASAAAALASEQAAALSESNAEDSEDAAAISESNALASENKAEQWAENPEDVEVEPSKFSSLHWANKSEDAADRAEQAASQAANNPLMCSVVMNNWLTALNLETIETLNFTTVLYTGNGTSQDIVTGIPSVDFTVAFNGSGYWLDRTTNKVKTDAGVVVPEGTATVDISKVHIKKRNATGSHKVFDGLRGVSNQIKTDTTDAENNAPTTLTSFNADGFSIGSDGSVNGDTQTFVAYQELFTNVRWGTTNQGKFYIEAYNPITGGGMIYYLGSGQAYHSLPHSQGVELNYLEIKRLDDNFDWQVHGNGFERLNLNKPDSEYTNGFDVILSPTEITMNDLSGPHRFWNFENNEYICYYKRNTSNWKIVQYTGTGAAGNYVEVGFKPQRVVIKRIDSSGNWNTFDNARSVGDYIELNTSDVEAGSSFITSFTDEGFIIGSTNTEVNNNGGRYIALVEADTKGNGGGSYYPKPTDGTLNVNGGIFNYTKGINEKGYLLSSRQVTKSIDTSGIATLMNQREGFVTKLYTGNGTSQDIKTGIGSVDFTVISNGSGFWLDRTVNQVKNDAGVVQAAGEVDVNISRVHIKCRSANSRPNYTHDGLRGTIERIKTESADAESPSAGGLTSFNSDGFSIGSDTGWNLTSGTFVAYQELFTKVKWGTTSDGKFQIEAYNPERKSGVIYYLGSGSAGHEIYHSQGVKADYVNIKNLNSVTNWSVWYDGIGDGTLNLDNTIAVFQPAQGYVAGSDTTSIDLGNVAGTRTNSLNQEFICYYKCNSERFKIVEYVGTGEAGNIVEVGFKPQRVIIKATSDTGNWHVSDNQRDEDQWLLLNTSDDEFTTNLVDYTDNGVSLNVGSTNILGTVYIMLVEAEGIIKDNWYYYSEDEDGIAEWYDEKPSTTPTGIGVSFDINTGLMSEDAVVLAKTKSFIPVPIRVDDGKVTALGEEELPINLSPSTDFTEGFYVKGEKVEGVLGVGQTWQDVTGQRDEDVIYTNNTDKPIYVSVSAIDQGGGDTGISLEVDGIKVSYNSADLNVSTYSTAQGIVPVGSTYSITAVRGSLGLSWAELR